MVLFPWIGTSHSYCFLSLDLRRHGREKLKPKASPFTTGNPTFAECKISSTRQSYTLPSAYQKALGKKSTLGKDWLCRVPDYRHSANPPLPSATRAALSTQPAHSLTCAPHTPAAPVTCHGRYCLPSATQRALGKDYHVRRTRPLPRCHERYTVAKTVTIIICRVPGWGTRQRFVNAECNYRGTRHSNSLPSVLFSSRRNNKKNFSNAIQTFFLATILYKTLHIRIWYIFCYVYYI